MCIFEAHWASIHQNEAITIVFNFFFGSTSLIVAFSLRHPHFPPLFPFALFTPTIPHYSPTIPLAPHYSTSPTIPLILYSITRLAPLYVLSHSPSLISSPFLLPLLKPHIKVYSHTSQFACSNTRTITHIIYYANKHKTCMLAR
jgi:hypothetical protein